SMILSQIARSIGGEKGVLSDGDVQRVFPKDYATSVSQLVAKLGAETEISETNKRALSKLLERAQENAAKYYKQSLETKRKFYSQGAYRELFEPGAAGQYIFDTAAGL